MRVPAPVLAFYKRRVRPVVYALTPPAALLPFGEPLFHELGLRARASRPLALASVERVLVVRLDLIGDFVFTTPFLRELRRNLPSARITLVVSPITASLARACPHVDEVLVFDPRRALRPAREVAFAVSELAPRRFDLALLPRFVADEMRGTFLAYASGARWRAGHGESARYGKRTSRGLDRLLTHVVPVRGTGHESRRSLDVLRAIGASVSDERPELWTKPEDEARAEELLGAEGVRPGDLLVALVPATSARKRDWPLERYAEIGAWLVKSAGARVAVFGGPREVELGRELTRAIGPAALDLTGARWPLTTAAALLRRARLYVGGDTGPAHMAAAVGASVVEISCHPLGGSIDADASPVRVGALGADVAILQPETPEAPCADTCRADRPHCILRVSVERVKAAVAERLRRS